MSLKIDRVQLEIVIKNDKARTEMRALEEEAAKVRKEMKGLKEGTQEYIERSKRLSEITQRMDELYDQIGLTGMSMKELTKRQRELNSMMRNLDPRTEIYRELQSQLTAVNGRIRELRTGSQGMGDSLRNMAGKFNHYFGLISAGAASIMGVVYSVKEMITGNAKLSDSLADVGKTTGMTDEEVKELYQDLKKFDTRTARSEMLDLARIAGKLGINAKKDVLQFVKAADQLNVALSEDLGGNAEEAIRQVGKLTDIFKLKEEFGMEQSFLKIGSAINALGAASTANEGYLVEFTKRVAGIAPNANISAPDILGLAATLDQLGQTAEVSSTVFSKLIVAIGQDVPYYANVAKMSVGDFSKLLKEDTNEAMLRVFEGAKSAEGGLQGMVSALENMGVDGARAVGVIGVLTNNTELLRKQQALSNLEFEKGTSLTEEFNRKNTNLAASLDKIRKSLAGMFVNGAFVENMGRLVNKFAEFITMSDSDRLIKTADTLMQSNDAFAEQDRRLDALIVTYESLVGKQNLTKEEQELLNESIREIGKIVPGAITQVDQYGNALAINKDKIIESREAQRLLNQEMNKKVVDNMVSSIESHQLAIQNANGQIKARQELIADEAKLTEAMNYSGIDRNTIIANNQKAIVAQNEVLKEHNEQLSREVLKLRELGLTDEEISQRTGLSIEYLTNLTNQYLENIKSKTIETTKEVEKAVETITAPVKKSYEDRLKELELSYKKEQLLHKQNYTSKELYDAKMMESESKFLLNKLALQKQFSKETVDTEIQLADNLIKASTETQQAIEKMFDADFDAEMAQLGAEYAGVEAQIQAGTENSKVAIEKAKQLMDESKKLREEADAARFDLLSLSEQEDAEIAAYEAKYTQGLLSYEDYETLKTAIHKKYNDQRLQKSQEFFGAVNNLASTASELFSTLKQSELDDINFKVENGLMSEEKGEEERKKIMKKYADKEFVAKAAQIVASTAVAIMQGFAQLGPIGGAIAAVLLGATGAVQLSAANKERQRVKQLRSGKYDVVGAEDGRNYSAPLVNSMSTGLVTSPTLVAEEPEIVVDPYRTNQILTLNPAIMQAIMNPARFAVVPQRASGKYPDAVNTNTTMQSDPELKAILGLLAAKLDKPVKATVNYYGTGGINEADKKNAEMQSRLRGE